MTETTESKNRCVLTLPLLTEPYQEHILEKRFKILEHLQNSLIALELRKLKDIQRTKAYRELEKEFTKKSQKLAKLEAQKDDDNQGFDDDSFKVAVDKFFENTPSAKPFARDIARKIIESPELKQDKNCLNIALMQVLIDKFRTPEQLMQDGQFLNDYVLQSSKVKDAIISTYLKDIREGQPPKTLSADGLQCVAPSRKIRSIEEAGRLFLKNNE